MLTQKQILEADTFVGQLDVALWLYNPYSDQMQWLNAAGLRLWQASSLEALNRRFDHATSPAISQKISNLQHRLETLPEVRELWTIYPNGQPVALYCKARSVLLESGEIGLLFESLSEVKFTPELFQQEAWTQSHLLISCFDANGRLIMINPSAEAFWGDRGLSFSERYPDIDFEQIKTSAWQSQTFEVEVERGTPKIWHQLDISSAHSPQDGGRILIVSELDISTKKASELQLKRRMELSSHLHQITTRWLGHESFSDIIQDLLAAVAQTADGCFAALFKDIQDPLTGHVVGELQALYPELSDHLAGDLPVRIDYQALGLLHWVNTLSQGITMQIKDSIKDEQFICNMLKQFKCQQLCLLPVFVDQAWWGHICIGSHHLVERWQNDDYELMQQAAELCGNVLHKEAELLEHRQAKLVFDQASEGIMVCGSDARILHVNPAVTQMTGYARHELIGQKPSLLKSDRHDSSFYDEMWHSLMTEDQWQGELWNRRKDGVLYPEWLSIAVLRDNQDQVFRYVGIMSDISTLKQVHDKAEYLAFHDTLTGLPNRLMFLNRLELQLARCSRNNYAMAVLFIDLDGFKTVNDSLGHHVGDLLLQKVASMLSAQLRRDDLLARLGGDEFVLLVNGFEQPDQVAKIATKVLSMLESLRSVEEHPVVISASIGIALYPENGSGPDELMRHADMAMYRAKENGKNQYHFFEPELSIAVTERYEIEKDLRQALDHDLLDVYYQPQLDIDTHEMVGLEALVRWNHPVQGMIPPSRFVPIALNCGLAYTLFVMVLTKVCRYINQMDKLGIHIPKVGVNVSGAELTTSGAFAFINGLLEEYAIDPQRIELEVTETLLFHSLSGLSESMEQLRKMGIQISIDDFGQGYSSLSKLRELPVDMLKIDKSFIHGIASVSSDEAIVRAIIAMGKSLQLRVIAEGIETETQTSFLQDEGCQLIQGFLYGRPMKGDELSKQISEGLFVISDRSAVISN